jgi:hypothetical protein
MSTFARRLSIPVDHAYSSIARTLHRNSTIRGYAEEYQRALAAAAEYESLKRLSQSTASDHAQLTREIAREVWRRHYA